MSGFDKRKFLPRDCFDRIFSERNIEAVLPGVAPDLLDFIKHKAKKVFATVLYANTQSEEESVAIMSSFQKQDFHDEHLLLHDDPKCKRLKDVKCSHPASLNLLHNKRLWRRLKSVRGFFDERWIFLAPVFTPSEFRHNLSPNTILPFEWVQEDESKNPVGGFSKVQHATIHLSHQTVLSTVHISLTTSS